METKTLVDFFQNEHILIIGGTGSLGHHLVTFLTSLGKKIRISILSRDENKQWLMRQLFPNVDFYLGDIRNYDRILDILRMSCPTIIILAAALKHIDTCESQPEECIDTNILGINNVIRACVQNNNHNNNNNKIKKVLFVSTDKSCSPVNVYGMSKAISERLINHVGSKYNNNNDKDKIPIFLCVRYGNVLNSRGSLIPKFAELAKDPKVRSFSVTDVRMTRFFMTLDQSIDLIFNALIFGKSSETWIPHVPSVKVMDIAKYFSARSGKGIEIVGTRPGEKIHECLINESELFRTRKHGSFYVISSVLSPTSIPIPIINEKEKEYTSETVADFKVLEPILDQILKTPNT